MSKHYVVCITKHPTHDDPHTRIQAVGTSEISTSSKTTRTWTADEVIKAIEDKTHTFRCRDKAGDEVNVVVATHNDHKYIKTENDGITQDNLLAQDEC